MVGQAGGSAKDEKNILRALIKIAREPFGSNQTRDADIYSFLLLVQYVFYAMHVLQRIPKE